MGILMPVSFRAFFGSLFADPDVRRNILVFKYKFNARNRDIHIMHRCFS